MSAVGPAHPARQFARELGLELRRVQVLLDAGFEFLERGEQRLGHIAAAERAEAAARVGILSGEFIGQQFGCVIECASRIQLQGRHARGGHELFDLVGTLDAGLILDAARHVDAEGRT